MSANNSGIDLQIRYTSRGVIRECKVRAISLGRYQNRYYIVGFDYEYNERRTYAVAKFRSCIRLDTGEKISKIKDFMLAYNSDVEDLTAEFEELMNRNLL